MPPELAERLDAHARARRWPPAWATPTLGRPDGRAAHLVPRHAQLTRSRRCGWTTPAARTGWRLVAFDRPGHGLSSPHPGATLTDLADDVADLADQLGLDRFAVLGYSGGAASRPGHRPAGSGRGWRWSAWSAPGVPRTGRVPTTAWPGPSGCRTRWPAARRRSPGCCSPGSAWSLRLAPATMARLLARRLEGAGWTEDHRARRRPRRWCRSARPCARARPGPPRPAPHRAALGVRRGRRSTRPVRVWHGDRGPRDPAAPRPSTWPTRCPTAGSRSWPAVTTWPCSPHGRRDPGRPRRAS